MSDTRFDAIASGLLCHPSKLTVRVEKYMGIKTYDVQCAVLAEHFLQDNPQRKPGDTTALAVAIQETVEAYLHDVDARAKPKDPRNG